MMFLLSPVLQSAEPLCTGAVVFEILWKLSRLKPSNWKYFVHLYLFGFFCTGFISVVHRAIYNREIRISVQ